MKIVSGQFTCVGLSLELLRRLQVLDKYFPGLSKCSFLVSCEENVNKNRKYQKCSRNNFNDFGHVMDKEHTMVAINIMIGDRFGILLCDPGYHVARVVTVMCDELYPHTGKNFEL